MLHLHALEASWIRRSATVALMVLPAVVSCARAPRPAAQPFPRLADVRRVYVAPLGTSSDADSVRAAIRQRLAESGRFVVADAASADAVLGGVAGVGQVETMGAQVSVDGALVTAYGRHPAGIANLQLLAASGDTIWSYDAPKKASDRTAVATVAGLAVERLLTDAAAADFLRQGSGQAPPRW